VTQGIDPTELTEAEKDALILALLPLALQLDAAQKRIAELEARIEQLTRKGRRRTGREQEARRHGASLGPASGGSYTLNRIASLTPR
jgi:hypothetical protein